MLGRWILVVGCLWGLGGPLQGQVFTETVEPLANGGFEQSVDSTSASGGPVFGGYWLGAEGRVIDSGEPSPPLGHGKVLYFAEPGDQVMQRFAGYEYLAQGLSEYEGATNTTVITGEVVATDPRVQTTVTLEENRTGLNAGSWGFYQEAQGTGSLGDDWLYLAQDTASNTFSSMTFTPPPPPLKPALGFYGANGAKVFMSKQVASPTHSAVRAYVAPQDGRLLVQARIVIDPSGAQPPQQSVKAMIHVYDGFPSMNFVDTVMSSTLLATGDGIEVSEFVDVTQGQVVVFQTQELDINATLLPAVIFDPSVSFDGRRVVYRFGQDFPAVTSDSSTWYAPVVPIAQAYAWQGFSLNAGQDYENWFAQFDAFAHGPQSQLSVNLELAGKDSPTAVVAFDNLNVQTGFRSQSEQGLSDEVAAEMSRIIQNHMDYGVDIDPLTTEPNIHVRNLFEIGDGTQSSLPLGTHSSLTDFVWAYSMNFLHPVGTPWLLDEVDSVVRNRDPDFGASRRYDFATGQYVPLATGDVLKLHDDIQLLLNMFDLTHDLLALDMAYEMGLSILDHGGSLVNPLYQSTFEYDAAGPSITPTLTATAFESSFLEWGKPMRVLAFLSARVSGWPARYTRHAEFLPAASGIATWIHATVAATPGSYGAYWMSIDNPLDDKFGYQSSPSSRIYEEIPNQEFLDVLEQGVDHFHPEWVQTFPRATGMAGDQQRAWDAWLVYLDQDPANRQEYGQAYLDAALNYVRTGQLGNGAWAGVNASPFHQPGLGGLGGTPVTPADGNKFTPLMKAWSYPNLASQGIVTAAMKDDLLAYLTTMWQLNVVHYGHYLESIGLSTGQLGYMNTAAYPDPLDANPNKFAGQEFRALGTGPYILEQLEPSLINKRPSAVVSPAHLALTNPNDIATQTFSCSDPNGWGDFINGLLWVEMTELQNGVVQSESTWYAGFSSDLATQIVGPNTIEVTWVNPPVLQSGREYRFNLAALDGGARWDMDSALYEIP